MAGMFPGLPIVMAPPEPDHPFKDPKEKLPSNSTAASSTTPVTNAKPKTRKEREKEAAAQAAAKEAAETERMRQQEIQQLERQQQEALLIIQRQNGLLEQQQMQLEHQRRMLEERRIAEDRARAAANGRWEVEQQHARQLQYAQHIQQGERTAAAMGLPTSGMIAFAAAASAKGPASPPQSAASSASSSGNGDAEGAAIMESAIPESTKSAAPAPGGNLPSPAVSRSQSMKTNGPQPKSSTPTNMSSTAEKRGGGAGLAVVLDDLMAELGDTIESFQRDSVQNGSDHRASNSNSNASVSDAPDQSSPMFAAPTTALPTPPRHDTDDVVLEADDYQFTVAFLSAQPNSYHGFLSKLSISRQTSHRMWKRRFFILTNAKLFLFRSSDPAELPLTFLPITTVTGGPTTAHSQPEPNGQPPQTLWILDVRGSGAGPEGTTVERSWTLQCTDEPAMNMWLDELSSSLSQQMRHVHQHQQQRAAQQPSSSYPSPSSPAATVRQRRPSEYTDISSLYSPFIPTTPTMAPMPIPTMSSSASSPHHRGVPPPISTSFPGSHTPPQQPSQPFASPSSSSMAASSNPNFRRPSTATSVLSHHSHSSAGGNGGIPMARRSSSNNANGFGGSLTGSLPSYAVAMPDSPTTPNSAAAAGGGGTVAMTERQLTQRQQYESYMVQLAKQQAEAQAAYEQKEKEKERAAATAAAGVPARELPMQ
ncbi:hypothetical protein HK101_010822, partial [Irineochytrium annulatum]